jgi:hypothetical protein
MLDRGSEIFGLAIGGVDNRGRFSTENVVASGSTGSAGYNRRLCSISLAGWPCRVSQALQEYWGYFYPATQG